jgi:hypothetical protein
MKTQTDAERIKLAMETRDAAELQWAREHATMRAETATADNLRNYWLEIVRRIETAAAGEQR